MSQDTEAPPVVDFPIEVVEIDGRGLLGCGFHTTFFSDVDLGDGETANVNSGAGCGTPWIVVRARGRNFLIDARKLVETAAEITKGGEEE